MALHELVEVPLVLLQAQYNIHIVVIIQEYKNTSVNHAVTLSAKPFKDVTQQHSNTLLLSFLTLIQYNKMG